ncbi:hypothetical protein KKF84_18985 [Myxococcota bacterium]|nr:hypothetical protein [Myxococcota bacterium]MBU1537409.1 hypothetical protein [Myxococcota bacterium]
MKIHHFAMSMAFLAVTAYSIPSVHAQESTAPAKDAKPSADGKKTASPQPAEQPMGLNVDIQVASAYVFRGLNVFQKDGQMNQNFLGAPGISWAIRDTGITVGYWGAWQLTGDNRSDNTDNAVNMEQDLYVSYEKKISNALSLKGLATLYFMPFADIPDISVPAWIEPAVSVTYNHSMVTLGLSASYFFGIQSDAFIRDTSYLYINPMASKTVKISKQAVNVKVGYGYKQFKAGNDQMSNVHDVIVAVDTSFAFGSFYVKPGLSAAWTNIEGPDATFSDGFVVWGSVSIGMDK